MLSAIILALVTVLSCARWSEAHWWVTHGRDLTNRRWAEQERKVNVYNAHKLRLRWAFRTAGDVTATPAVFNGIVYAPDWTGGLYAIDQKSGRLLWSTNFSDYGFPAGTKARATPAVATRQDCKELPEDLLIVGTSTPAVVVAVKRSSGELVWKTVVDDTVPSVKITAGGTVFKGSFYVGVSSMEEDDALNPAYKCCRFVGSTVRLDLLTGRIVWKTYTLPRGPRPGGGNYAGGAVWASTPSIDLKRSLVYTGSGNLYSVPHSVAACQAKYSNRSSIFNDPCIEPGNHFESVFALRLGDGKYSWSRNLNSIDAWTLACTSGSPSPNCPANSGPDYDFGMSPMLLSIPRAKQSRQSGASNLEVAVIGQKSGIVYALDRSSGKVVWATQAGPGGDGGGIVWGMAADEELVYLGIENNEEKNFTLVPSNKVVTAGGWVALNATSGRPVWSVANPNKSPAWGMLPSVANGVVVVTSADPQGHVYALHAKTGKTLWRFSPGFSVYGGAAIVDGCIYFGTGYAVGAGDGLTGGGPQKIYAFCV